MGRPLRARYANTTYSDGVQEMSDAEINDLVAPLILTYAINNPTTFFETTLRINSTPAGAANSVSRGVVYDINAGNIATHPASQTTISTYTAYQSELAQTLSVARPVHYVYSGGAHQIAEMADSDIYTNLISPVVQTMIAGGQAGYYLGLTSSGAPATGTWASVSTLTDTYYNASSVLVSDSYTLWQRSTGTTAGTIRPLKLTGGSVIEMSNTDITNLSVYVSEYIRTTGIGKYALQVSAPTPGTWTSRGTYTDTTNTLATVNYTGYFAGTYVGYYTGYYSGSYVGNYSSSYSGSYVGNYTTSYAGAYTGYYTTYYAGTYVGYYTTYYVGYYTGYYITNYAGSYLGYYVYDYAGYYVGGHIVTYVNYGHNDPYSGAWYGAGVVYAGPYAGLYYVGPGYYKSYYVGYYTGYYRAYYGGRYTGYYATAYAGGYAGGYATTYVGYYTGGYATSYAGSYVGSYIHYYAGTYVGSYTSYYAGTYVGAYATAWTGSYVGSYANYFAGLTVQTTTSTTTYTLWVRTA